METQKKKIPLIYLVKAQSLYVKIFEWEDDDGIQFDEYRSYKATQKAFDEYLDKMFLDDRETKDFVLKDFNNCIARGGTFELICNELRKRGYEVISAGNSTVEEIKQCRKECLEKWKEWRAERCPKLK